MDDINKTLSEFLKSISYLPDKDQVTSITQVLRLLLQRENSKCTTLQSKLDLAERKLILQQAESKERLLEREYILKKLKEELGTYYGYNNTEILKGTFSKINIEIQKRREAKQKFIQQWGGPPAIKKIPVEYKIMGINGKLTDHIWNYNSLRSKYYGFSEIQIPNYNEQKLIAIDGCCFSHNSFNFDSFIKQKQTHCKYDVYKITVYICNLYILPSIDWLLNNKYKIYYTLKGFYDNCDRWIKHPLSVHDFLMTIIWKDNDTLYHDLMKCHMGGICAIIVTKVELVDEVKTEETCAVCCDTIEDPVFLSCMHKYCKNCVDNLLKHNTKKCPLCRTDIQINRISDTHSN